MITKTEIYILTNQAVILGALALLLPDEQVKLNNFANKTHDYCQRELVKANETQSTSSASTTR